MKKGLVIILFLAVSLAGFSQENVATTNDTELVGTVKADKSETTTISLSAKVKAKVLKMNRKKSNEIISIKAYRKSLQIRVKTVKLC